MCSSHSPVCNAENNYPCFTLNGITKKKNYQYITTFLSKQINLNFVLTMKRQVGRDLKDHLVQPVQIPLRL